MVNKLIILIFILALVGCRSTSTSTVKTHEINDTIIYKIERDIKLPVRNVTIINNPCKGDSLAPINQTVKSESSSLTIKSDGGNLVIEQNIDSIVNSKVSEILKHSEKQVEVTEKIITKTRVPSWAWWTLGVLLGYVGYRIARNSLPILKFLPY